MSIELIKPDNEQLIPELLAALRPKSCKLVTLPDLTLTPFNFKISYFGQKLYIVSDSYNIDEAKNKINENVQLICTKNGYHIFTDLQQSTNIKEVIYLCLIDIIEWKIPIKLLLNRLYGDDNWEMFFIEKYYFNENSEKINVNFGLLKAQKEEENDKNKNKQIEIWLIPINQCINKKIKKKILRKVPKKSKQNNGLILQNNNNNDSSSREQTPSQTTTTSSEEINLNNNNKINEELNKSLQNGNLSSTTNGIKENGNIANIYNGMKSNENNKIKHSQEENNNKINGNDDYYLKEKLKEEENQQQPIYLEIPVQLSSSPPKENNNKTKIENNENNTYENGHHHNNSSLIKELSPLNNSIISAEDSDSPNSLSYVSAQTDIISNRRSWRREDAPSPSTSLILQNNRRNITPLNTTNQILNNSSHRLVTPLGSNLSPISSCGSVEGQDLDKEINNNSRNYYDEQEEDEEEDESTLMLLNKEGRRGLSVGDDVDELTIMSSIREDISLRETKNNYGNNKRRFSGGGRHLINGGGQHFSPSPPPRNSALSRSICSRNALSRSPSTAATSNNPQMVRGMLGIFRMPVPILQQIIGLFTFKEIGLFRQVHPHWDELSGQLLNAAHFKLIQRAQHLLTDCQRRINREPRMAQPVKLLNRLHVHALNPVDGMRAFMDEGVLCFPYGAFLDLAFDLLFRIDKMIENNYDEKRQEYEYNESDILMDKLAEITKRAVKHYKKWVEPEAEKRMSELYRASAQQRLQRIDSFLVESSVSRVEREAEKNRNEMSWEMEQLKQQNSQLKKESRDLRQLCQRLDQRVDVLERKFKTMARLLQ